MISGIICSPHTVSGARGDCCCCFSETADIRRGEDVVCCRRQDDDENDAGAKAMVDEMPAPMARATTMLNLAIFLVELLLK